VPVLRVEADSEGFYLGAVERDGDNITHSGDLGAEERDVVAAGTVLVETDADAEPPDELRDIRINVRLAEEAEEAGQDENLALASMAGKVHDLLKGTYPDFGMMAEVDEDSTVVMTLRFPGLADAVEATDEGDNTEPATGEERADAGVELDTEQARGDAEMEMTQALASIRDDLQAVVAQLRDVLAQPIAATVETPAPPEEATQDVAEDEPVVLRLLDTEPVVIRITDPDEINPDAPIPEETRREAERQARKLLAATGRLPEED
jgi:hypothetical protein